MYMDKLFMSENATNIFAIIWAILSMSLLWKKNSSAINPNPSAESIVAFDELNENGDRSLECLKALIVDPDSGTLLIPHNMRYGPEEK